MHLSPDPTTVSCKEWKFPKGFPLWLQLQKVSALPWSKIPGGKALFCIHALILGPSTKHLVCATNLKKIWDNLPGTTESYASLNAYSVFF